MALDTASEGNFNTKNPEEAIKLIENLASNNCTKNSDYERRESDTNLDKAHMDEVKAKLGGVHKLLMKQVSFTEVEEVAQDGENGEEKEAVNFVSVASF